MGTLTVGLWP